MVGKPCTCRNLLMKYKDYTALDFANDAFFIRWVRHCDEESNFFWQAFVRENPSSSPCIEEARNLILSFEFHHHQLTDGELMEMRKKLWMHFLADKASESVTAPRSRWWLAAASILVPILLLTGYLSLFDGTLTKRITSKKTGQSETLHVDGNNSLILLSDGSRIWLRDSSTISYHEDFGNQPTRDVHLEGEAFFEVTRDVHHPFIVHTSDVKIKVLGTSFSVKSYAADKTVETTLVSGKVHIEQSDEKGKRVGDIELKPNQKAVFHKESKVINVREISAIEPPEWKRSRLVFDGESISNVLLQLERWYEVDIHVDTNKLGCKLTATIEKESLHDVLNLLTLSHGINYTVEGRNVFITGDLCK